MNIVKFYKNGEIKKVKVYQGNASEAGTVKFPTVAMANRTMFAEGHTRTKPKIRKTNENSSA
jgi:hypothetical protein